MEFPDIESDYPDNWLDILTAYHFSRYEEWNRSKANREAMTEEASLYFKYYPTDPYEER